MFDASLPNLPAAFSRRRAILGVATFAASPAVILPALAAPSGLDPADARLIELLDTYKAADVAVSNYPDEQDGPVFDALVQSLSDIENEMAATFARSMTGVMAKARLCQIPSLRDCMCAELTLSIADDLVRLHHDGGTDV